MCTNTQERYNFIHAHETNKLGKGGFGTVYGDSQFAIKTINVTNANQYTMFKNEMRFMIALGEKPNFIGVIPQMCYYERTKNQTKKFPVKIKITMDRMKGDLNKLITKEDIPEQENPFWFLDVAFQMVATLRTLHNSNALHLDIKPDNILFMNKYTPVLSDFGLTSRIHIAAQKTKTMGTQFYLGAEILNSPVPQYTKKTDIYAMGLTLIEFFQMDLLSSKIQNLKKIPKEDITTLTSYFKNMLNAMILYYDAQNRPSTQQILTFIIKAIKAFDADQKSSNDPDFYPQALNEYINAQMAYYNQLKNNNDPTTIKYYDQLVTNLEKRAFMYYGAITGQHLNEQNQIVEYTSDMFIQDLESYTQGIPELNQYFDENLQKKFIDEKEVQIEDVPEDLNQDIEMVTIDPDKNAELQYDEQDKKIREQLLLAQSPQLPQVIKKKGPTIVPTRAQKQQKPKNKIQQINLKQQIKMANAYGGKQQKFIKI